MRRIHVYIFSAIILFSSLGQAYGAAFVAAQNIQAALLLAALSPGSSVAVVAAAVAIGIPISLVNSLSAKNKAIFFCTAALGMTATAAFGHYKVKKLKKRGKALARLGRRSKVYQVGKKGKHALAKLVNKWDLVAAQGIKGLGYAGSLTGAAACILTSADAADLLAGSLPETLRGDNLLADLAREFGPDEAVQIVTNIKSGMNNAEAIKPYFQVKPVSESKDQNPDFLKDYEEQDVAS